MDNPRTNAELLVAFERVCFELISRPTEKCYEITHRFNALESRMKNCMGISDYDFLEALSEHKPQPELRNWIEQAIGKQWANPPSRTGYKGHREVYEIDWVDGTSQSYFIDWEEKRIEEVWPGLVRSARYPYEVISEARNG